MSIKTARLLRSIYRCVVKIVAVIMAIIFLLFFLYAAKTVVGIDLFPGMSIEDFADFLVYLAGNLFK